MENKKECKVIVEGKEYTTCCCEICGNPPRIRYFLHESELVCTGCGADTDGRRRVSATFKAWEELQATAREFIKFNAVTND